MISPTAGSTFAALLAAHLRADAGRPLVTFYDEQTSERVELSVATYSNWVAKTASLFTDELDLVRGDTVHVDLPTHWLTPVFLGAAWTCGLIVDPHAEAAALVICGPESVARHAEGAAPVLATALLPLGARFAEPLPASVLDFGAEVWSQPDAFAPYDPPSATDEAMPGRSQADLAAGEPLPSGVRLLTTENPAGPEGPGSLMGPLVAGGSTVWVRHADPETWPARYAAERPDLVRP